MASVISIQFSSCKFFIKFFFVSNSPQHRIKLLNIFSELNWRHKKQIQENMRANNCRGFSKHKVI